MDKRVSNANMGLFAHPLYVKTSVELREAKFDGFSELLRLHSIGDIEASHCLMDILTEHGLMLSDMLTGGDNFTGCELKVIQNKKSYAQFKSTPAYALQKKKAQIEFGRLLDENGYRDNKASAYNAVKALTNRGERDLRDDWKVYEAHQKTMDDIRAKYGFMGNRLKRLLKNSSKTTLGLFGKIPK